MKRTLSSLLLVATLGGCATEGGTGIAGWESWQSGALIGAGLGGVIGAVAYSNASEAGRQLNRRVEIYVEPVVQG
jgi:hypothetical protein